MSDYPYTAAQLQRQRAAERQLRHDAYSYRGEREQSQQTLRQAQELLRELAARDTLRAQTGVQALEPVRTRVVEEELRLDITGYWVNGVRQDLARQPPRSAPEPTQQCPVQVMVEGKVSEWQPTPPPEVTLEQQQAPDEQTQRWENYRRYHAASPTDSTTRAACEQEKARLMTQRTVSG